MVSRLGIGATTASAVIFSILLASDLVVFAASQGREAHYLQANAEDSVSDEVAALTGAAAANILTEAQGVLASTVLDCSAALQTAAAAIGGLSDAQRSGGMKVNASASLVEGPSALDNLSMVAPFNGSLPGEVDIALRVVASGMDAAAGVSFSRDESHLVHVPVRLQTLAGDCVAAFDDVSNAVTASAPSNCSYASVAPIVYAAGSGPASVAAADDFSFSLTFSLVPGAACAVSLVVSLAQAGIQGPAGGFTVRLKEQGAASFEPPAPRQRA